MKAIRTFVLSNYFWLFAFASHLLVLFLLYSKSGISFSNESEKYLAIARRLSVENYREELRYLWGYSFYIFFLALCFKLGFSVYFILLVQYLISLTGFYLFYKFIVSQTFLPELYSRICLLLIVTCPVMLYWQLTFYTESVFPALVMISIYYFFKSEVNPFLLAVLWIIVLFCRPVGVFYAIALVFVLIKKREIKFAPLFLYGSLAIVFVIILLFLPIHYNDFALPVYQGSVICGFPAYPQSVLSPGNYSLLEIYGLFLKEHGLKDLLVITLKKIVVFFTITRPYYSIPHNLINSVYYAFIIGGLPGFYKIAKKGSNREFIGYFSAVFIGSLLIVALVYNEWSERFIVPLLPFFILLALIWVKNTSSESMVKCY